jgi:hypothetical protein
MTSMESTANRRSFLTRVLGAATGVAVFATDRASAQSPAMAA